MKNNIHFIGIGGSGMSALAKLTKSLGFLVSGSDISKSPITDSLKNYGITVCKSHKFENIPKNTSLIVYSAAIPEDNPELIFAQNQKIPSMKRAEFLGNLMSFFKFSAAVSGTHGKSTTSSMLSEIFLTENLSPTSIIGADAPHSEYGFIKGKDKYFIAEACEYKNGILHLKPFSALILNIEYEHPDFFKTLEDEVSSFRKFAGQIDPLGFLVINKSCDLEFNISSHAKCQSFTFDTQIEIKPDFYPLNIKEEEGFFSFDMYFKDLCLGKISLSVPGLHNVSNALAAGALAYLFGIEPSSICKALSYFSGVKRRLEYKGKINGADLFEDYAHHPTEISASLTALRKMTAKKIVCVFQPHTYSRTIALFKDFAKALSLADLVLLAPIYGAREKYTDEINSEKLSESISLLGSIALNFSKISEIGEYLKKNLTEENTLIIMGAGDINNLSQALK